MSVYCANNGEAIARIRNDSVQRTHCLIDDFKGSSRERRKCSALIPTLTMSGVGRHEPIKNGEKARNIVSAIGIRATDSDSLRGFRQPKFLPGSYRVMLLWNRIRCACDGDVEGFIANHGEDPSLITNLYPFFMTSLCPIWCNPLQWCPRRMLK